MKSRESWWHGRIGNRRMTPCYPKSVGLRGLMQGVSPLLCISWFATVYIELISLGDVGEVETSCSRWRDDHEENWTSSVV